MEVDNASKILFQQQICLGFPSESSAFAVRISDSVLHAVFLLQSMDGKTLNRQSVLCLRKVHSESDLQPDLFVASEEVVAGSSYETGLSDHLKMHVSLPHGEFRFVCSQRRNRSTDDNPLHFGKPPAFVFVGAEALSIPASVTAMQLALLSSVLFRLNFQIFAVLSSLVEIPPIGVPTLTLTEWKRYRLPSDQTWCMAVVLSPKSFSHKSLIKLTHRCFFASWVIAGRAHFSFHNLIRQHHLVFLESYAAVAVLSRLSANLAVAKLAVTPALFKAPFHLPTISLVTRLHFSVFKSLQKDSTKMAQELPMACIVARTFYKHGHGHSPPLLQFVRSVQALNYRNWEMVVVITDSTPFPNVANLLEEAGDLRIRLFIPPGEAKFVEGEAGYFLTDLAVEQCSSLSRWLLVTNADNHYHRQFLDDLDHSVDIIGYDFYSRYTHLLDSSVFGRGCARWRNGGCKRNIFRSWHTDLGANIVNLRRWRCEKRKFSALPSDSAQDGFMIESMIYWGWSFRRRASCLFSHFPNPFACRAFLSNDWDEAKRSCLAEHPAGRIAYKMHAAHGLRFTCWGLQTDE